MAEARGQERLLPSLLDRLTDEEPEREQESRDRRVLSMRRYREGVIRDLGWLLNTANLEATEDLDEHEAVAKSVVNFGMPDLTGSTSSTVDVGDLERRVRQAIWDFEPRIVRKTVTVRAVVDREEMSHNALWFEIFGQLWAQPVPEQLFLRTQIDLETGHVTVDDAPGGGGGGGGGP